MRIGLPTLTGVVLVFAGVQFVGMWRADEALGNLGEDFAFYVSLARRWLETGVMYGDRQLAGVPYHVEINVDNLYPPPAILLFALFVYVPWPLWWAIPIAVVIFSVWWLRPAMWTWPLLSFCLLWPRTQGAINVGNSDMWAAGFVAAGLIWGWPAVLGLFKPAFAPFVLVGIRRRSWWLALAGFAGVSLLFAPYWLQYLSVVANWDLPWWRSAANVPFLLLPVIVGLGRTRPVRQSLAPGLAAPTLAVSGCG